MALFLTEADVAHLLPIPLAIEAVEAVFRRHGEGNVVNQPRARLRLNDRLLHVMSAALPGLAAMGLKAYTTGPGQNHHVVLLWSGQDGRLEALIEASRLGQIRTGAASGVATKFLAREDAQVVGLYGAGWQAESQIRAVCGVRTVRRVQVYSRDPERRRRFCRGMEPQLGVEMVAVDSPAEAARDALILITATNARDPVLLGDWVEPGSHVNAIGSNALNRREIDAALVERSQLVVVDAKDQARIECGDLVEPMERGILSWDDVRELGEVVVGKIPGRPHRDAITLFESQGLAMEDVAVASGIVARARAEGVGTEIPL